jgi:hypothetical protein
MDDDTPEPSEPKRRETMLAAALGLLGVGFLLLVLIVITGGLVIYLLAVVGGLAVFAALHYFLWGRAMHDATAGEREEEELRDKARADGWDLPPSRRGRR